MSPRFNRSVRRRFLEALFRVDEQKTEDCFAQIKELKSPWCLSAHKSSKENHKFPLRGRFSESGLR